MVHSDIEVIKRYIDEKQENEFVDFKLKTYGKDLVNSELVKDVVAFANGEAKGDKYIIFGIADETKEIVGIPDSEKFEPSVIENSLDGRVEPRIRIECGEIQIDGKRVAYIKIPEKNDNSPYIIKRDGGKNPSIRQGDIFVRIGTSNRKANREDLDRMYLGNKKIKINITKDSFRVGPVRVGKKKGEVIRAGIFELELYNPTSTPIILCDGTIRITSKYGEIERNIWGFDVMRGFGEAPYTLGKDSREIKRMYFDFLCEDCIQLRFRDDRRVHELVRISIELYDTENNIYQTEIEPALMVTHEDVLYKLDRLYKDFRDTLQEKKSTLVEMVKANEYEKLRKELASFRFDFTFVQPEYVLGEEEFPEYDVLYAMVMQAIEGRNDAILDLLRSDGLTEEFIEFCKNEMNVCRTR